MTAGWLANLVPARRVTSAISQPFVVFRQEIRTDAVLLVSLSGDSGSLYLGLADAETQSQEAATTVEGGLPSTETVTGISDYPSAFLDGRSFDEGGVIELMRSGRHFVVPIASRATALTPPAPVTVGRTDDKDIVLRDPSVSKFHAWFTFDPAANTYSVADAASSNGTRVNGERIGSRDAVLLRPGDRIRFGAVTATFCTTALFWLAVHSLQAKG